MASLLDRRRFLLALGALGASACLPAAAVAAGMQPALRRIRGVTLATPDPSSIERLYVEVFGYVPSGRGRVPEALAQSWGAPACAGRNYLSLRPASGADVFIRAVEIDEVPGYRPLSTTGWNAVELIADDVYALFERLRRGPFEILGEPKSLGGSLASIHAMQLVGPAREVVYLSAETGNRDQSTLPIPRSAVDRPFIMVLAGGWLGGMEHYYSTRLGMVPGGRWTLPIAPIARAQGLAPETPFEISLLRCAEKGHGIELDAYPATAGPRRRNEGQLPPGIAITSFAVEQVADMEAVASFLQPPAALYGEARAASFLGPVGELVELIEDGRAL